MSLLDTLKSLLGLDSSRRESRQRGDVGVTVEREPGSEPSEPRAPSSSASTAAEPSAETEHEVKGTDRASDRSEAGETSTGAESEPDETDAETGEAETDAESSEAETDAGAPTTEIKGIGPAYADRLSDAGIDGVDQLADADPEALAEETGLSEKRIRRWVERAQTP